MKINLYRLTMVILCVAGIFFTGSPVKAQGLTISVATESTVTGQYFTLGDIATLSGDDNDRIAGLRQIRLGHVPGPGQSYVLSGEILAARLGIANTDLTGITWQIPPQVKITALSQVVSGQLLSRQAEQYLKTRLTGGDVIITAAGSPKDMLVPPGVISFQVELPYGVKYNSPTNVSVGIQVNGQPFAIAKLRFDIKKYGQVVVASRALALRDVITTDSIILERRDIGRMPPGYFTDINKILGLSVKRQIAPGQAITDSLLTKPVIIQRGKAVNIVANIAGIEVFAAGVALQNGSEGQYIRVQNTNSKKILTGLVINETTVKSNI